MIFVLFVLGFAGASGSWTTSNQSLSEPVTSVDAMVVTESGEVLILDRSNARIIHLDASGKQKGHYGRRGQGPGEMQYAHTLHYLPQNKALYIHDRGKGKMLQFNLKGEEVAANPFPAGPFNDYLILSPEMTAGIRFDFSKPDQGAEIVMWQGQKERVLHRNGGGLHQNSVVIFHGDNVAGWDFDWQPKSIIAATPDGKRLFVGSTGRLRFEVYDVETGKSVGRIEESVPRVLIDDQDKAQDVETFKKAYPDMAHAINEKAIGFPEFKTPVKNIIADSQGRLWVSINQFPSAKQSETRVYAQDGSKLGSVFLEKGFRVVHANANWLWGFRYNEKQDQYSFTKRPYKIEGSNAIR